MKISNRLIPFAEKREEARKKNERDMGKTLLCSSMCTVCACAMREREKEREKN